MKEERNITLLPRGLGTAPGAQGTEVPYQMLHCVSLPTAAVAQAHN